MERREPLSQADAKKEITRLMQTGTVVFVQPHTGRAMAADKITNQEVLSVLRGGLVVDPAEYENDQWRYRVSTGSRALFVVVTFVEEELRIVTTWRRRR